MSEEPEAKSAAGETEFSNQVGAQAARKLGTSCNWNHRAEMADHANVPHVGVGVGEGVVERAFDPLREAVAPTEELTAEAVEQGVGFGATAIRVAESEAREGTGGVEVVRQDRTEVAVQGAQHVAGAQR